MPPSPDLSGLTVRGLKSPWAGPFELDLGAGERLAVLGASGAGKSLLLRMIADLDPCEGLVRLNGVDRAALSGPQWRRLAPYVAAEPGWWGESVEDHFAPGDRAHAAHLAQRLGLDLSLMAASPARLSTGERQRLALIRALVLQSPLLLLDEPTGSLDPVSVAAVEALLIERARAGAAIILVTHDPAQALRLGARTVVVQAGRLEPAGA